MKATFALLAMGALALSACNNMTPPADEGTPGDSAGSAGPAYCESPPANPDDLEHWNQLCMPGR